MKSPEETPRLIEDAAESGELKLGLERMSSNLPSAEQLASLAARLGVTPNGAPAKSHAPASKTLLKIAAGAGLSGAVLFALLRGSAPGPASAPAVLPTAAPSATAHTERSAPVSPALPTSNERAPAGPSGRDEPTPPAAPSNDPSVAPDAPLTETPEVSAPSGRAPVASPRRNEAPQSPSEPAAPKVTSRAPVSTIEVTPAPARAPVAAAPSETAVLRDARLALSGDPARALALTEQHRREYPNGSFAQEREVIAITALARLGRSSEARSRAERFRNAYPTSPYIERVDRAVPP